MYMTTTPGVRKVVHQQMTGLIKTIGMTSGHLLQLVAQFPKGGEGFVLQVLRILTETTRPTIDLVNAVKVAHKRLGDARLLIPVLGGMEKDEVIGLLPRLLVLPPAAAKTVVTRLAVGHSPLTCTELLVALHLVENVPIKRMLEATQTCLEMDTVFKQDVMAVVLSQLSSQPHVPQLFMFTALQTLQRFHKLTGYIVELMINLIPKQVWTDKRLWDGFVRCCKVAKPTSYKVTFCFIFELI
jgi:symplekin